MTPPPTKQQRMVGCLLGGAIGDALGAPVEFLDDAAIRRQFGEAGVSRLVLDERGLARITDDTQMALFTAEGVLGARRRNASYGISSLEGAVFFSYLRWLATQGERPVVTPWDRKLELRGLLYETPEMRHRRAPGATCLAALRAGRMGSPSEPINDSKGCGGVMRLAPVAPYGFDAGVSVAALTHGHPTGYLAGGALAEILRLLLAGQLLREAVESTMDTLAAREGGGETVSALRGALRAADRGDGAARDGSLGQGWVAEEALAIGVYAASRAEGDIARGLCLAVNHSGDSDSTGSIAGNLLGAMHGSAALPEAWASQMEAADLIERVARDLCRPVPDARRQPADFDAHALAYPYC